MGGDAKVQQHPLTFKWLKLEVTISTQRSRRRRVGRSPFSDKAILQLGPGNAGRGTWIWEGRPDDVEAVDQARSTQSSAPIDFQVDKSGIGKLVDDDGHLYDLIAVRSDRQQLKVDLSQRDRLLHVLGLSVPTSEATLVGQQSGEHPAWTDASKRSDNARLVPGERVLQRDGRLSSSCRRGP